MQLYKFVLFVSHNELKQCRRQLMRLAPTYKYSICRILLRMLWHLNIVMLTATDIVTLNNKIKMGGDYYLFKVGFT